MNFQSQNPRVKSQNPGVKSQKSASHNKNSTYKYLRPDKKHQTREVFSLTNLLTLTGVQMHFRIVQNKFKNLYWGTKLLKLGISEDGKVK